MKKPHGLLPVCLMGGILLIAAALASCAPDTTAPERQLPTETTAPAEPVETVLETPAVPRTGLDPVHFTDTACVNCHTNEQVLRALATDETSSDANRAARRVGSSLRQMEAWERVFIDGEAFAQDVHGLINCTTCHGGQAVGGMDAHQGLVADPSADPIAGCGTCHPNIAPFVANSLHFTLRGFETALAARSSPEHASVLEELQILNCNDCHAICGDCHISQPDTAGGGLLDGHVFASAPPVEQTCSGCHGSPVGVEFFGELEGLTADVHFAQAEMICMDCHTGDQMHGLGPFANKAHRYDGPPAPSCLDCHQDDVGIGSGNLQHELHGTEIVSCQVCHSVDYLECSSCHVDRPEEGIPFDSVEAHETAFLIGRNPLISNDRPWRYVPVRHVPIDVDSFSANGSDLLVNFLNRPTWAYATPHNIQRNTPQTASCVACHGNDQFFLTPDKVAEAELGGANLRVIVEEAPPIPPNAANLIRQVTERLNAMLGAGDEDLAGAEDATKASPEPTASPTPTDPAPTEDAAEDSPAVGADDSSPGDVPAAEATATAAPTEDDAAEVEATPAPGGDISYWGNLPNQ